MSRRTDPTGSQRPSACRTVLRALLLLLVAGCGPQPLAPTPGAPLVLISIDTLRADHLGCYGYERPTTPRLDALAAESLLFEDVLACASSTAPSHMSLMTGVLPRVHGIANTAERARAPAAKLLAELLTDAGYRTTAFADGGHVDAGAGFDRGFEHFESGYEWWDAKLDRIDTWLAADDDGRPDFLFVHTYGVHAPYLPGPGHDLFSDPAYDGPLVAPVVALTGRLVGGARGSDLRQLMDGFWPDRKLLDAADKQQLIDLYDGAIHRVDAGLGRLLDTLDERGWLERAWIVVTADHGEAFGEHGSFQHRQVHQEELSVPLLIRPPGGLPGGRRVSTPISQLDLPPTLLSVLGLVPPASMQGRSLLPLDRLRVAPRFATGGEGEAMDVVVERGRKLISGELLERAVYALDVDPGEQANLLPAPPATDAAAAGAGGVAAGGTGDALASEPGPTPITDAAGDEPAWLRGLRGRLATMKAESAALRKLLGDPLDQGPLSPEQIQMLEALGYLQR